MTAFIVRTDERYFEVRFAGGPKDGETAGSAHKGTAERYAKSLGYAVEHADERKQPLRAGVFDPMRGI